MELTCKSGIGDVPNVIPQSKTVIKTKHESLLTNTMLSITRNNQSQHSDGNVHRSKTKPVPNRSLPAKEHSRRGGAGAGPHKNQPMRDKRTDRQRKHKKKDDTS